MRAVLLTHGHLDHSEGAVRCAELAGGVPVRALDPAVRLGDEGLADGDVVEVGGRRPARGGHARPHLGLAVVPARAARRASRSADRRHRARPRHHRGRPPGRTARALPRLAAPAARAGRPAIDRRRVRCRRVRCRRAAVLPGHGPVLDDAAAALRGYLAHRAQRLDQVRAALAAGDRTVQQVVERVYADVDRVLWPAATLSVRAQLEHLRETGEAGSGRRGLTRLGAVARGAGLSGRGAPGGRRRGARRRAPRAGSSHARRSRPGPC